MYLQFQCYFILRRYYIPLPRNIDYSNYYCFDHTIKILNTGCFHSALVIKPRIIKSLAHDSRLVTAGVRKKVIA
jgi:hypothetical protein